MAHGDRGELTIKQFLYDWLPPAYDHPSLWHSKTRPRPYEVGGAIGWVASNYRGQHAGSITLDRTTVEIVDVAGGLTNDEVVGVMSGLRPVDADARAVIVATPLGHLCYDRRHPSAVAQVPLGYWQHIHQTGVRRDVRVGDDMPDFDLFSGGMLSPDWEKELRTAILYKSGDRTVEVEHICEEPGNLNAAMRLIVTRRREAAGELAEHCMAYPPEPDDQDCDRETLSICGTRVHHAYAEARYGSHEAVFASPDNVYMFLVKPRPDSDRNWFLNRLAAVIHRMP